MGDQAFYQCESLKTFSVERRSKLKKIGKYCLSCSSVEEVTFPAALEKVGRGALEDCINLMTVWVEKGCRVNVTRLVGRCVEVRKMEEGSLIE